METILTAVGGFAVGLVALFVQSWWRRRRAKAWRADLGQGGRTTMGARLTLPGRWSRSGQLALAAGHAVWAPRWGTGRVDLTGGVVLHSGMATGAWSTPDDVLLRIQLTDRRVVEMALGEEYAGLLVGVLRSSPSAGVPKPPSAPKPGRSWWAWLLLGLGGLWVAYCLSMYVTGYSASVEVVGGDGEGFCDVVWTDADGIERSGEADCDDEPTGSLLDVRVTGWPDPGDPTTPGLYVGIALMVGLPPALVGGLRLLYLRSRRNAWSASVPGSAAVEPAHPLPPLTEDDLRLLPGEQPAALLARLAPYTRRQIPRDDWEDARRPAGATSAVRPRSALLGFLWPIGLVAIAAAIAWPLPAQWYALTSGPTTIATATSTGERALESFGPVPESVTVRFRDGDGRAREADVAVDNLPPTGSEVDVEYALADPSSARLVGKDDALGRGVGVCVAVLLIALLWCTGLAVLLTRRARAIRIARTTEPRPALGLLIADAVDGTPVVLAVDPLVSPVTFVPVPVRLPLPEGTCAHFQAYAAPSLSVRGALRAGETVVLEVDGLAGSLLPAAPATAVSGQVALDLLDSVGAQARSGDDSAPEATLARLGGGDRPPA
ncbi:hypothetical protein [Blastococcus sp. LR1]|uniref:hypothetical protein n=1 Tax=Blastococcus sp. LR1 TaxID=2877000 RepID=UPI001CCA91A1|nr:hypothetical protein [Blastococcus sp. LR1]MCA0144668.1 hypothetical protein [Blastococcus sp. LR1]